MEILEEERYKLTKKYVQTESNECPGLSPDGNFKVVALAILRS